MKKFIKYILFGFTGLIALVLILLLFTQTAVFRNIVKEHVVKIANRELNGKVEIAKLEGNFFSHLSIRGLFVGLNETDTLLTFDELSLRYSLWPLLQGKVQIESIILTHPFLAIEERSDSTWNFQKLFPESAGKEDSTSSGSLSLSFELGIFKLEEGQFSVRMNDSIIPATINDLNMEFAGRYSSRSMLFDLEHLGFVTPDNIPDLHHLQFVASMEDSVFSLADFVLETTKNNLTAQANYSEKPLPDGGGNLQTTPFYLSEFSWVLPEINIGVNPEIKLKSGLSGDDVEIDLTMEHQEQQIRLRGIIGNFSKLLNDSLRHQSELDVSLFFQKFDPGKWLMLADLPLVLNGTVQISGNGLENSNMPLELEADLIQSRWDQYHFRELILSGNYLNGATKMKSRIATQMGVLDINAETHLKSKMAPFELRVRADRFPASRFLPEWGDSTLLNVDFISKGTGRDMKSLNAGFNLEMEHSVVARVPVDTLIANGQVNKGTISLEALHLINHSIKLNANGDYSEEGVLQVDFETLLSDLNAFRHYVEVPATWDELQLSGKAGGHTDSLLVDVILHGRALRYDTIVSIEKAFGKAEGLLKAGEFSGDAGFDMHGVSASSVDVDSIHLGVNVVPKEWDIETTAWLPNSLGLAMQASGNFQMPFRIFIPVMDISTPFESFVLDGDGVQIFIDSTRMALSDFSLSAQNSNETLIKADGEYVPHDSIDVMASIESFDLSLIEKLGFVDQHLYGITSFGVSVKGELSSPVLNLDMRSENLEAGQVRIGKLNMKVSQFEDTLRAYIIAQNPDGDSLTVEGFSPVQIRLSDSEMISTIKNVNGRVFTQKLRPSSFFEFDNNPENQFFQALVDMDIAVDGPLMQPVLTGFLNVSGGEISFPSYGVRYNDLKLRTRLDSNRVMVDSLFARHDKGTFLVSGNAAFDSSLVSGNFSHLDMSLKARDFFISRHPNHEIQINTDTWLTVKDESPVYGGNLTVLRSSFYLPALLDMGASSDVNEPMLVKALEEELDDSILLDNVDTIRVAKSRGTGNNMMKNLTGKVNVKIPRNTWVKSEDMNLELYGDFDLLKNNEYFEIFGMLGISRGYYTLYGRKLIVQEGELTFQGGKEINPRVNLKAGYSFRGKDKQKNELVMTATGTAFEPKLSFTLNGSSITERDAMAYLIFNQSFDELSFSNQEGVSGNLPSAMLSGLVSSQLTKTVGNTLNLDMVEVQTGDNWESATFMVGKYITNNLFVTYQRGFGESEEESLTPQKITLEYELTRNLFFRLTQGDVKDSGIDVILKFEKE